MSASIGRVSAVSGSGGPSAFRAGAGRPENDPLVLRERRDVSERPGNPGNPRGNGNSANQRGSGDPGGREQPSDTWERVLASLENDVETARALLTSDGDADAPSAPVVPAGSALAGTWRPPTGLGPLPAELAPRAQNLLRNQQEIARRLATAAQSGRSQSRLVDSMKLDGAPAPVLLDQDG